MKDSPLPKGFFSLPFITKRSNYYHFFGNNDCFKVRLNEIVIFWIIVTLLFLKNKKKPSKM